MRKKLITGIITSVILITGIIGFVRLRYLEQSIWIFRTGNEQTSRGGHFERGTRDSREFRIPPENFGDDRRRDFTSLPDSVRQRMIAERQLRAENDSLRQNGTRAFSGDRVEFGEGRPDRSGRQGHDFRRGSSVQLGNVFWFLAVFSLFTLVTIFLDYLNRLILRRKKQKAH